MQVSIYANRLSRLYAMILATMDANAFAPHSRILYIQSLMSGTVECHWRGRCIESLLLYINVASDWLLRSEKVCVMRWCVSGMTGWYVPSHTCAEVVSTGLYFCALTVGYLQSTCVHICDEQQENVQQHCIEIRA